MSNAHLLAGLETLIIVATVKLLGDTIYNYMKKFSKRVPILCSLLVLCGFVLTVVMSSLEKERIPYTPFYLIPVGAYLAAIVALTIVTGKIRTERLGNDCIIEAFDRMDLGLCYSDAAGRIMLCNEYMHEFCIQLQGHRVLSGIELQQAIQNAATEDAASGNYEIFLKDKYYLIAVKSLSVRGSLLTEIKCTDVTDLREKTELITEENKRLQEMNSHLISYGSIADQVIREREILNAKIRMHDRFGELLLTAKRAIEKQLPEEEMNDIITYLRKTIAVMDTTGEIKADDFGELEKVAKSIGVSLHLNGELPKDAEKNRLCCLAIRECISNTVKHANGHNLYIDIADADFAIETGHIHMVIMNDGAQPNCEPRLGTGLSSLKSKLEKNGGTMEMDWQPEFAIRIRL